jgi:Fe-S-cluster-containing dehydrogenase component
MKLKRRDFLKATVGSGLMMALAKPSEILAHSDKKALPPEAVGILYDSTLCIGCQACMVSCKNANYMPIDSSDVDELWDNPQDLSAKTLNIIKRYSEGNGRNKNSETDGYAYIKRHCMHCLDPSCVSACPVSAMRKDKQTGVVTYNKDACIGCRYCQVACPYNIPKFEWESTTPEIVKCQLCNHLLQQGEISACCSVCPTGASLFGTVDELLTEAKRRLNLKVGIYEKFPVNALGKDYKSKFIEKKVAHYVQHIYGENEVGGSQVLLLSGVPFNKIGLPDLPDESFVRLADGIQYAIYKGMAYPIVVLGALIYMVRKGNDTKKKSE